MCVCVCSYAIWGSDATGITKETGRGVEGGKRNSPEKKNITEQQQGEED